MDLANVLQYEVHDVQCSVSANGASYGVDITVSNNGSTVVIVTWIKIRFCMKPSAGGRRIRICFSTVFSTRIEVDGQSLERLVIHPGTGHQIMLTADIPLDEWENRKGFEEVELAVFEATDGIGVMQEIAL